MRVFATIKYLFLLLLMLLVLHPRPGYADVLPDLGTDPGNVTEGPLVRRQFLYRASRHELVPGVMTTLSNAYVSSYLPGVRYQYSPTNWLGFGASFNYNFCSLMGTGACKTGLGSEIVNRSPAFDEMALLSRLDWTFAPQVSLVPVTGKVGFSWFGQWARVINYDFHLLFGAVVAGIGNAGTGGLEFSNEDLARFDKVTYGPMVGIGTRIFFNEWMGLNVELRDVIMKRALGGVVGESSLEEKASEERIANNFMLNVGVSLFFPRELSSSR